PPRNGGGRPVGDGAGNGLPKRGRPGQPLQELLQRASRVGLSLTLGVGGGGTHREECRRTCAERIAVYANVPFHAFLVASGDQGCTDHHAVEPFGRRNVRVGAVRQGSRIAQRRELVRDSTGGERRPPVRGAVKNENPA